MHPKRSSRKGHQAVQRGKSPGYNSITAEILKTVGDPGIDALHLLCERIWNTENIPGDWGKAVTTPIFKKKDKLDCNNYRGISLLSHPRKTLTHIILVFVKGSVLVWVIDKYSEREARASNADGARVRRRRNASAASISP